MDVVLGDDGQARVTTEGQKMKLENQESTIKVLVIEDNPADVRLIREMLSESNGTSFHLQCADRLSEGLKRLAKGEIQALLLDLSLPDSTGFDTFVQTRARAPQVPIIVLSGQDDQSLGVKAVTEGAQDYIVKSRVDGDLLSRAIRYAIERHRLTAELEQIRTQQLKIKDQFLSHVSHELRSPLAAIYQFATILWDGLAGNLNHEQRDYVNIVLRNVKQLQTMINDLLEVTRADSGKLTIDPRRISVVEYIAEALATLVTTAAAKNVILSADLPNELPIVYADPQRVKQILTNLIDNAIKFTGAGGSITVGARVFDHDPKFICVAVADTGTGISAEGTQRIFDRLYQETNTVEASRKGLGLGLHICKELVTRHGGRIWVESCLGKGSAFYFTLPVFSLARLLFPVLTENNRLRDSIAVISVEIYPKNGAPPLSDNLGREAWTALQRGILSQKGMLLPRMPAPSGEREYFYIVECGGQKGTERVVQQIRERLGQSKELHDHNIGIKVSTTAISSIQETRPIDELVTDIAAKVEELIKTSIAKKTEGAEKDLLGLMSSEVRGPLSVIMGYGGILQDKLLGDINPDQESALGKVIGQSNDLLMMINNIIETQRVEARAIQVEKRNVNLKGLLHEITSAYEMLRPHKPFAVTWDYPPDLPAMTTDRNKLKLILQNLIHNAVKFTEDGSVTVSARYLPEQKTVEFKVKDTGLGISSEAIPAIFERFRQLQSPGIKAVSGMGLGLYVVKVFTELLGGQIDVESQPGKGSVFQITLPVHLT